MAYERKQHGGGAVDTTLNGDITSGATSLSLTASTNWPDGAVGPFVLIIDPGLSTEEKMLATARTTLTCSGLTRGYDGTSASAHSSGAVIKHIFSAVEADEANALVHATLGTVAAKGDLQPATGAGALGKLTVGADKTVLVANSGQTTGMGWATLDSNSLAANSVGTTQLASQAVTSAKIATAAVDGTTIVGGNGTALGVGTGGVGTTQLAATSVTTAKITDANVTTAKLADASVTAAKLASAAVVFGSFASTVRPVQIVTSGTHPGSPSVGDRIFETDTGNELVYQSSATAWTPPWNTAWGELDYKQILANPADVSNSEATILQSNALTLVANRKIVVEFHCSNVQCINNASFLKIWVTDSTNTHLVQMCRETLVSSATMGIDKRARLTSAAGSFQPKIRAIYGDAGGAARFNAGASLSADPSPIWVRIIDEGPTGAPA